MKRKVVRSIVAAGALTAMAQPVCASELASTRMQRSTIGHSAPVDEYVQQKMSPYGPWDHTQEAGKKVSQESAITPMGSEYWM